MIYEVRTYTLHTGTVPEFEARYERRLPARLKHA
ncbi:MAG: NIPSNAP family protein [Bradyrhizobiaceae bacterium]|nr:NIPSNAP family protein [Bradyrhizobiaceae bacterium]